MAPSLTAEVTSDSAYAATGFDVETKIPQTYDNADGLATSTLKKEVVTLPEGMTVNPSSGAGLGACSEAQYAEEGAAERSEGRQGCPNESKLASVKIETPSLSEDVKGSVYLAEPAPRRRSGQEPVQLAARAVSGRADPQSRRARQGPRAESNRTRQTGQLDDDVRRPAAAAVQRSRRSNSTRARTRRW